MWVPSLIVNAVRVHEWHGERKVSSICHKLPHSDQRESGGADTVWWDGDGRVSHGQHQWRGQSGRVHLQCESPPLSDLHDCTLHQWDAHIFNQISPPSWFIALASWTFSRFKVKAVSVLLSSFILCPGFLATFSDSIRWPWGEIHLETWAHWLWSLSGPTRSPTASGSSTWPILWWNQESPRVNADLQEKWSTCWTSL